MDKKDGDFIKISQVVGQGKVVGPLSVGQIVPLIAIILLICVLHSFMGLFNSILLGAWLLGITLMLGGARPDRFNRRLTGKPKRWSRGWKSNKPLLTNSKRDEPGNNVIE